MKSKICFIFVSIIGYSSSLMLRADNSTQDGNYHIGVPKNITDRLDNKTLVIPKDEAANIYWPKHGGHGPVVTKPNHWPKHDGHGPVVINPHN